jgi:hypothetical protein
MNYPRSTTFQRSVEAKKIRHAHSLLATLIEALYKSFELGFHAKLELWNYEDLYRDLLPFIEAGFLNMVCTLIP